MPSSTLQIRALILSILAGTGCEPRSPSSIAGCMGSEGTEDEEGEITASEAAALTVAGELDCEDVCRYIAEEKTGGDIIGVQFCELETEALPNPQPDTVVGTVECTVEVHYFCEGRRPIGHATPDAPGSELAEHLAMRAHLEAASVIAFEQLAERLQRWNAPADLVARCRRAALQEREHAETLGDLARARGATVAAARCEFDDADLLAAALDNAIEGCVHETWAAMQAAWIARHAREATLRRAYEKIAVEEAEHGQLAWDLHAWFTTRLGEADRTHLERSQRRAIERLPGLARAQARHTPPPFGLLHPDVMADLATRFAAGLHAPAA